MALSNKQMQLMSEARGKASFDSHKLTYIIHGNEATFRAREAVLDRVESFTDSRDQMTLPPTYAGGDGDKQCKYGAEWGCVLLDDGLSHDHDTFIFASGENTLTNACPLDLRPLMFIPTIQFQGSPEQRKHWLPLAESGKVIGTCAQTELGHSNFIHGLETTATLDTKTDEFLINSPTITSTKFWPGGLRLFTSHAVVVARLVIKDTDYGIHSFLVPIRCLDTWEPFPDIELGDVGIKTGSNKIDSSFAVFRNVRIPRTNMLMGLARVDRNGNYQQEKEVYPQAIYGTSLLFRSEIVKIVSFLLAKAVTIATRYSTVRTQGHGHYAESPTEVPLMSFKSQHARLLGLNAQAFAILFASKDCGMIHKSKEKISFVHALISSIMAYTTQVAVDGAEAARKCCGGQGYSVLSALPDIVAVLTPQVTWEGDSTVLYQQTGKYLMKIVERISSGGQKNIHPSLSYLIKASGSQQTTCSAQGFTFLCPQTLLAIFHHRASRLIHCAATAMSTTTTHERPNLGRRTAWNEHMLLLISAAKAHTEVFVLSAFIAHTSSITDPAIKSSLEKNLALYALNTILACPSFFEDGFISLDQADTIRALVSNLHEKLVPDAIALTDAWGFSDQSLKSAIGVWDGNVYETMMAWVRQFPVNQSSTEEGGGVAGEVFRQTIGPMLGGKKAKL